MALSKKAVQSTAYDPNERIWERLSSDSPSRTSLEPVLLGFQEASFQASVQHFVTSYAPQFAVACQDGSCPLVWTQYHNEYKALFESQFERILCGLELTKIEAINFLAWLKSEADFFDDDNEGLYRFLEIVTAQEDFQVFQDLMFAEVRRQLLQQETAASQIHEIEVSVPDGAFPGHVIAVDYLGRRFDILVPDGCVPGMAFRASVSLQE